MLIGSHGKNVSFGSCELPNQIAAERRGHRQRQSRSALRSFAFRPADDDDGSTASFGVFANPDLWRGGRSPYRLWVGDRRRLGRFATVLPCFLTRYSTAGLRSGAQTPGRCGTQAKGPELQATCECLVNRVWAYDHRPYPAAASGPRTFPLGLRGGPQGSAAEIPKKHRQSGDRGVPWMRDQVQSGSFISIQLVLRSRQSRARGFVKHGRLNSYQRRVKLGFCGDRLSQRSYKRQS